MSPHKTDRSIDAELQDLRSSISDLGYQIDSYKTKMAASLGGGVFALLLAAGAFYDLATGKSGVWLTLGITREDLRWIATVLALGAVALLALGFGLRARRDRDLIAKLDQMEREYADRVERERKLS